MMDCLTNFNSSEKYDCINLVFQNCTNGLGFDFGSLQNIAQIMQSYCATDIRLFGTKTAPATPNNVSLTNKFCKEIAPKPYTRYPYADILARLQTWKFPLFQLAFSTPRPPLGLWIGVFVLTHLMGDPIGTIKDLREKLARCEDHAIHFEKHKIKSSKKLWPRKKRHLSSREWKALAMICVAYDEWGEGYAARKVLEYYLDTLTKVELEDFLGICEQRSDRLAADRGTAFLPILAAEGFFVGALGVAVSKTSTIAPGSSMYINVEAHSIAFSSLYFWIIPAVFLGAIIGVSQTKESIPSILRDLENDFGGRGFLRSMPLPEAPFAKNEGKVRKLSGGIYAWQPDKPRPSISAAAILVNNGLAIFSVTCCAITAGLMSWYVPVDGWQPRHYAYTSWFAVWSLSFLLTTLLKQPQRLKHPEDISLCRFWLTFAKDAIVTGGTLAALMYIQIGPFNNCEAYSENGRAGVALPGSPDIAEILNNRIHGMYRVIAFTSMGFQLAIIPLVALLNRRALRVLLQNDDGTSLRPKWLKWPEWLKRPTKPQVYKEVPLLECAGVI